MKMHRKTNISRFSSSWTFTIKSLDWTRIWSWSRSWFGEGTFSGSWFSDWPSSSSFFQDTYFS